MLSTLSENMLSTEGGAMLACLGPSEMNSGSQQPKANGNIQSPNILNCKKKKIGYDHIK